MKMSIHHYFYVIPMPIPRWRSYEFNPDALAAGLDEIAATASQLLRSDSLSLSAESSRSCCGLFQKSTAYQRRGSSGAEMAASSRATLENGELLSSDQKADQSTLPDRPQSPSLIPDVSNQQTRLQETKVEIPETEMGMPQDQRKDQAETPKPKRYSFVAQEIGAVSKSLVEEGTPSNEFGSASYAT